MYHSERKIYSYFRSRFVMKKTGQNWYAFDNPFDIGGAGKKKMAVHFDYQMVKCWRTGYRESVTQFVMDYEECSWKEANALLAKQEEARIELNTLEKVTFERSEETPIQLPEGFKSLLKGDTVLGKRARNYLEGRGFNLEDLDDLGFGYCTEEHEEYDKDFFGFIIIPFHRRGELVYYIGRNYMGSGLRYKNPPKDWVDLGSGDVLFNEDALLKYKEVYILEGWPDDRDWETE